ncbi:hypothetical protein M413DRAFT_431605 [Hebeloma cylindrosporum]|uniref:Uncharacterized protein n=1 Tax=Hebeloma cylindrosporum TaxID=76867 RepID=A0A0C3CK58_HEBCY|nr:hypothetical protein M413DRAFT_431605 [Hebeloma cylindrosporum h7]
MTSIPDHDAYLGFRGVRLAMQLFPSLVLRNNERYEAPLHGSDFLAAQTGSHLFLLVSSPRPQCIRWQGSKRMRSKPNSIVGIWFQYNAGFKKRRLSSVSDGTSLRTSLKSNEKYKRDDSELDIDGSGASALQGLSNEQERRPGSDRMQIKIPSFMIALTPSIGFIKAASMKSKGPAATNWQVRVFQHLNLNNTQYLLSEGSRKRYLSEGGYKGCSIQSIVPDSQDGTDNWKDGPLCDVICDAMVITVEKARWSGEAVILWGTHFEVIISSGCRSSPTAVPTSQQDSMRCEGD